jgi:hypothetical protein
LIAPQGLHLCSSSAPESRKKMSSIVMQVYISIFLQHHTCGNLSKILHHWAMVGMCHANPANLTWLCQFRWPRCHLVLYPNQVKMGTKMALKDVLPHFSGCVKFISWLRTGKYTSQEITAIPSYITGLDMFMANLCGGPDMCHHLQYLTFLDVRQGDRRPLKGERLPRDYR